jgi:hypothetical protein
MIFLTFLRSRSTLSSGILFLGVAASWTSGPLLVAESHAFLCEAHLFDTASTVYSYGVANYRGAILGRVLDSSSPAETELAFDSMF